MKRREFIALSAALAVAPFAAHAIGTEYVPGLAKKELDAGKTVFLDFSATWCSTCAAQERAIKAIQASNPAYEQAISFINVDWDKYGRSDLSNALNIPRRSTLVVLKGNKELGRIIAGTSQKKIKKLMDIALAAAVA